METERSFHHIPVMVDEVIELLAPKRGGIYVDCTLGAAGHTRAILDSSPDARVIGIDQDPAALAESSKALAGYGGRVKLVRGNFRRLSNFLDSLGIQAVDGVLFDLGVSSPQFDEAERGFSYRYDAPLDMRMDPDLPVTARDIVNTASLEELTRIIREYGEERWASRIAMFIVERRRTAPIQTTGELAELIKDAIPAAARREGGHPARRTFQALRIAVNDELAGLEEGLRAAIDRLAPGGRVAVISFHSLEDRIVKRVLREYATGCTCPPSLPVCVCGKRPVLEILTKGPVTPSEAELARNPRARSAKLRAARKF